MAGNAHPHQKEPIIAFNMDFKVSSQKSVMIRMRMENRPLLSFLSLRTGGRNILPVRFFIALIPAMANGSKPTPFLCDRSAYISFASAEQICRIFLKKRELAKGYHEAHERDRCAGETCREEYGKANPEYGKAHQPKSIRL
ncbi:MAG: hypothetical protein Q4G00_05450 [Clostridia bacterium]|nr:hypothetical protein [Clostridia bacterium]